MATNGSKRRSANFRPSAWDYNFVQSLRGEYGSNILKSRLMQEVEHVERVTKLKEEVKDLIRSEMPWVEKLEQIDAVQRLGLGYHFELEIKSALQAVINGTDNSAWSFDDDLHATALRFRLLRQNGFNMEQGVFERFMTEDASSFKESLREDVEGLLSLYEASFYGFKGEAIMDEAKTFSSTCLENLKESHTWAKKVNHALDMPVHWRPNRLEARWFMDMYEEVQCDRWNPVLLDLAKLDFNVVQSIYRDEVSKLARWWVNLGLNKMEFCRDRLMEHYLWNALMVYEPQFGAFREMSTKITCMITLMDDVYDVFGSWEELQILTKFIERWDISEIDKLPPTIRTCFLAMYNTTNEIGYWTMKAQGFDISPYLHKLWINQGKTWLEEAKWYHEGHKPTLQEYLNASVTSIGGHVVLVFSYFTTSDKLSRETLEYLCSIPSVMYSSSLILRLTNDLSTSSAELARGDNFKSLHCYMNETGASEEATRHHLKNLVRKAWKQMNEDVIGANPCPGPFLGACLNLARASQLFYQYGDGHGIPDRETKDNLKSILIRPVPIKQQRAAKRSSD
ncbi:beta-bisabolene synthase-like [Rhodamnia argentea]|uniref:Beta-bisabolene synthase-like n=1 Tax=Rhodamnia argentea TaxID=178133 RepID=A0ABM3GTY4_9MYRT|nr:beta-bisabolene synthase-like [Rhodamnia argentea]